MSQFNAPSYEIPKTSGQCAASGRQLEPTEVYFATLVEVPEDEEAPRPDRKAAGGGSDVLGIGLKRIDVSKQAWDDGFRPPWLFCFWKTTVPEPNQKKNLFVDDAVLMNLLHRLADTEQPSRLAFRYVLALILMRKKLLRYDGTVTRQQVVDGEPVQVQWWKLVPKLDLSKGPLGKWNENDLIEVLDPKLDEVQIEQVTQQIGEILEAEL